MTAGAGDNVIRGTSLNDYIDAGAGADAVFGGVGNDTIVGGAGLDAVAGGPGLDTYVAGVSISAQRTMFNSQTISLAALGGRETIREFERIQFTDGILALDLDGNAGQGYRIYQAAFARTPDKGGLS
ncbi:calcium-binding protein [Alsobacter sp. SYSU BS001988]